MKTQTNFRLSDEALTALAELMDTWGLNRTQVVERALFQARGAESKRHQETTPLCEPVEIDSGLHRELVERDPNNARIYKPRIDRDKIAAFQRQAGMGGAGKK